jgi:CelD/BcsL family acetyltransferase involved in cellulose biosynthesis
MDRVGARDHYYYPLEFFLAFWRHLGNNARFALAEYDGEVVAATLYLYDDVDVYSYLGGADHRFQRARPTNALIYETIRWAQSKGKKRLILGGGHKPDDGILRFKASFSPLRARFEVYKRIHLPDKFAALCDAWSAHYCRNIDPGGYFPPYRSIPAHTEK